MLQPILDALGFNVAVFFLQIVLFVVLLVVMNGLFWKPMLGHLHKRDARIEAAHHEVEATRRDMEQLRADYQARIARVEADARERIQAAVKEAQHERERLVAETRAASESAIRQSAEEMEREKAEAMQELRGRMVELAMGAASKALGTAADSAALRRTIEQRVASASLGGGDPLRN